MNRRAGVRLRTMLVVLVVRANFLNSVREQAENMNFKFRNVAVDHKYLILLFRNQDISALVFIA
jgi:hypothetical protein